MYSQHGTNEIVSIFGDAKIFDFPKPSGLIRRLLRIGTRPNDGDIILDFFAGSGSTGHAVLAENLSDGGNRRYIATQLPEKCSPESQAYRAGFKDIAQIGRDRMRRVGEALKSEQGGSLSIGAGVDLGFKAYSLGASNFKIWGGAARSLEETRDLLDKHVDHLAPESSGEDILYELLLKAGFPLTTKVNAITLAGKEVFSVEAGAMLICLEKEITSELIDALAEANPLQVICLDEAFKGNDQLKANAVQTFKARAEAEQSEIVFRTV